jgi:hypothetical protein
VRPARRWPELAPDLPHASCSGCDSQVRRHQQRGGGPASISTRATTERGLGDVERFLDAEQRRDARDQRAHRIVERAAIRSCFVTPQSSSARP